VAAAVTDVVVEGKDSQGKNASRGTRKPRTDQGDQTERQRFFLAKPGGSHGVPELGKEFPGEAEAIVESLKTGLSYFVVSEWRGVADFSGRKPQLARQAVQIAPKAG
jgi:hypothetical protein